MSGVEKNKNSSALVRSVDFLLLALLPLEQRIPGQHICCDCCDVVDPDSSREQTDQRVRETCADTETSVGRGTRDSC